MAGLGTGLGGLGWLLEGWAGLWVAGLAALKLQLFGGCFGWMGLGWAGLVVGCWRAETSWLGSWARAGAGAGWVVAGLGWDWAGRAGPAGWAGWASWADWVGWAGRHGCVACVAGVCKAGCTLSRHTISIYPVLRV